jgi:hypothetical protein
MIGVDMVKEIIRRTDEIHFAVKVLEDIAQRRKDENAVAECVRLEQTMELLWSFSNDIENEEQFRRALEEVRLQAYDIADELRMVTNLEIREVLFPLPDIKQQAREFGTRFFGSYFRWLDENESYTPEKLMSILEDDIRKLDIARTLLQERVRDI